MILYHCGLLWHDSSWRLFITPGFGHNASKFSWILFWSCIITFITDLCKNMTCSCCLHLHLVSLIKPTLRHSLKWFILQYKTKEEKLLQYSLSISFDVDRQKSFKRTVQGFGLVYCWKDLNVTNQSKRWRWSFVLEKASSLLCYSTIMLAQHPHKHSPLYCIQIGNDWANKTSTFSLLSLTCFAI